MSDNYNRGYNGSAPDAYSGKYKDGEWYAGWNARLDEDKARRQSWIDSSNSASRSSSFTSAPSWPSSSSPGSSWTSSSSGSSGSSRRSNSSSGEEAAGIIGLILLVVLWKVIVAIVAVVVAVVSFVVMLICAGLAIAALTALGAGAYTLCKWYVSASVTSQWVAAVAAIALETGVSVRWVLPWAASHGGAEFLVAFTACVWFAVGVLLVPLQETVPTYAKVVAAGTLWASTGPWAVVLFRRAIPAMLDSNFGTAETFALIGCLWIGVLLIFAPLMFIGNVTKPADADGDLRNLRTRLCIFAGSLLLVTWGQIFSRNILPWVIASDFAWHAEAVALIWMWVGAGIVITTLGRLSKSIAGITVISVYALLPLALVAHLYRSVPTWIEYARDGGQNTFLLGIHIAGWTLLLALTASAVTPLFFLLRQRLGYWCGLVGTWIVGLASATAWGYLVWQHFPRWFAGVDGVLSIVFGSIGWLLWLGFLVFLGIATSHLSKAWPEFASQGAGPVLDTLSQRFGVPAQKGVSASQAGSNATSAEKSLLRRGAIS